MLYMEQNKLLKKVDINIMNSKSYKTEWLLNL